MSEKEQTPEAIENLLHSTSTEVNAYLERAIGILERASETLRGAKAKDGLSTLSACVEGLAWLLEYSQAAKSLPQVEAKGLAEDFAGFEREIYQSVQQIVATLESGDSVFLADLVEYELVPCLNRLRESVIQILA
jgi:hypothetical protein